MSNLDREDFDTPAYRSWRYAVMTRDQWTCQLTGKRNVALEVHHIVPWALATHLRYAVSNGITLCKEAHDMVLGREKEYEEQFKRLVAMKEGRTIKSSVKENRANSNAGKVFKWNKRNPRLRYG